MSVVKQEGNKLHYHTQHDSGKGADRRSQLYESMVRQYLREGIPLLFRALVNERFILVGEPNKDLSGKHDNLAGVDGWTYSLVETVEVGTE